MKRPSWLVDDVAARLERAVEALERGAGEKLISISLVGSTLPPARHTGDLELSLVVVVGDLPVAALSNMAHQLAPSVGEGVAISLFTERELLRSADVFTLELAEHRARHVLLHGSDPFQQLHFTAMELRLSIETWLRSLSRELRDGVVSGVAHGDAQESLQRLFARGVDRLAVAAHHLLQLLGQEPPATESELISALAERGGVNARSLVYWVGQLRGGEALEPPMEAIGELLSTIDGATCLVDALGVGPPSERNS